MNGTDAHAPIYVLKTDGIKLYASTGVGKKSFYASSNGGAVWNNATGNLALPDGSDAAVTAFGLSGSTIFAGAGFLFSSTNAGVHWDRVPMGSLGTVGMVFTNISVFGPDVLAAAAFGLVVSHDAGATWNTTDFPFAVVPVCTLAVGSQYFVGGQYNTTLATSVDHGDHWTDLTAGLPLDTLSNAPSPVFSLATHGTRLFAGMGARGVYVSNDKGLTWAASNNGLVTAGLTSASVGYSFATNGNTIYVGTDSGVYTSGDDGANWAALDRGDLPEAARIFSMTTLGGSLFIGTYSDGVWKHTL